jgi:hypothetical protein
VEAEAASIPLSPQLEAVVEEAEPA